MHSISPFHSPKARAQLLPANRCWFAGTNGSEARTLKINGSLDLCRNSLLPGAPSIHTTRCLLHPFALFPKRWIKYPQSHVRFVREACRVQWTGVQPPCSRYTIRGVLRNGEQIRRFSMKVILEAAHGSQCVSRTRTQV